MKSTTKEFIQCDVWPMPLRLLPMWVRALIWYGWLPLPCLLYLVLRKFGLLPNILEEGVECWILVGWPITALILQLLDWGLRRRSRSAASARAGQEREAAGQVDVGCHGLGALRRSSRWIWIVGLIVLVMASVFALLPDLYPRRHIWIPFFLGAVWFGGGCSLNWMCGKNSRHGH